uniref:Galanin-like peptide n=1 Tax=Camelus bactrianus TaxID=9837 RepID=A0A9W3EZB5_CAMBA|nr:galanin-like peptide [Camelus bactrianus]XP_010960242.1 galanin-like peptide [Camelus bactrianus]XP_010960243.1 galanin-like peptide [Camelus bactrianus]XP_045377937.1 galanin-like peptide [Camelus bactrianus]XP_045377938.1 galanin-like peptide [Camelus bactrianus]
MQELGPRPERELGRAASCSECSVASSARPGPQMAPSVCLVLLAVLLSLAETPASAPVPWGRGGWTLNSAGYLLGPVPPPPPRADGGREEKMALGTLDLWKAIDGLPHSQSQLASRRGLRETFAKPEIGGLGVLGEKVPKEEDLLQSEVSPNVRSSSS